MKTGLLPCPKCMKVPDIGYVCGEYFILPVGECFCGRFNEMHSSEEKEAEVWNMAVREHYISIADMKGGVNMENEKFKAIEAENKALCEDLACLQKQLMQVEAENKRLVVTIEEYERELAHYKGQVRAFEFVVCHRKGE